MRVAQVRLAELCGTLPADHRLLAGCTMLRCCCCWLELPASCAVSRPCTLLTLPACLATPPRAADAVPGMHGLARSGSYLQMDTDGRVIRVDSFAKFLAPGLRLGWVTAHPKIVEKLTMIIQVRCRFAGGA